MKTWFFYHICLMICWAFTNSKPHTGVLSRRDVVHYTCGCAITIKLTSCATFTHFCQSCHEPWKYLLNPLETSFSWQVCMSICSLTTIIRNSNIEEMLLCYYMDGDVISRVNSSVTHWRVLIACQWCVLRAFQTYTSNHTWSSNHVFLTLTGGSECSNPKLKMESNVLISVSWINTKKQDWSGMDWKSS